MSNRPKCFSQQEIQHAIDETRSFCEASRYLNCSYNTFKKYTKLYNLWIEGGKNPSMRGIPKFHEQKRKNALERILEGKKNGKRLNITKFRERLIRELKLPEKCDRCNFEEKRITDFRAPLVLIFKDGDRTNYKLENLKLLCYNCTFLMEGNIVGRKKQYFSDVSGDIYEQIRM